MLSSLSALLQSHHNPKLCKEITTHHVWHSPRNASSYRKLPPPCELLFTSSYTSYNCFLTTYTFTENSTSTMDFLGWLFRPITQPINKSREEFVHQANRYYDLLQRLTSVAVVIGYSVVFALVCFGLAAISSVIVGISTQRTLNGLIERLGSNASNLTQIPEVLLNGHDSQDRGQQALSCSVDMQTTQLLSGRGQRSYFGSWLAIACLAVVLVTLFVAFQSRKTANAPAKRVHHVASPMPAREFAPPPTRPRPTRPARPWSPKKQEPSAGRKAAAVSASIGAGIGGGIGGGIAGGAGGLLATGIGCAFFPPLAIAALPMLVVGVLGGGAAAGTASALSAGKAVERGFEMKDREMVNRVRSRF